MIQRFIHIAYIVLLCCFCSCIKPPVEIKENLSTYDFIPVQIQHLVGYINRSGELLIPPSFLEADYLSYDLARVKGLNGKVGYINRKGDTIIEIKWLDGTNFRDGLAWVSSPDGLHCINTQGKICFSLNEALSVTSFSCNWAIFHTPQHTYKCINTQGHIIASEFKNIKPYSEGMAAVQNFDNQWGYINHTGVLVIPLQYEQASDFQNGMAIVCNNEQWNYIDRMGKNMFDISYRGIKPYSDGMLAIKLGDKWGYIDNSETVWIQPQFDQAFSFNAGIALVQIDNKYGYIDKYGNYLVSPQYDKATSFLDGWARVKINEKYGFIDMQGHEVVPPQYDYLYYLGDDVSVAQFHNKMGLIGRNGQFLVNPIYDNIPCYRIAEYGHHDKIHIQR